MCLNETYSKVCRGKHFSDIRFEVFTAVTIKNGVFWVFLRSVRRLLVAASVVPSSPIFVTMMKEAPGSSETSVLIRATRRNNPEDTILHFSDSFLVQNGLKEGDSLSPLFNVALEYAIRMVQENQVVLKLNETHQLLAYDDVDLLGDDILLYTINSITETLTDASTEVGIEVNVEKTKYMLESRDQNAEQNWDIKIGNR
jgi:hypothetical protein